MTLDEAIERYKNNAEYERRHSNLQGCLDFRQLAEWLKDYKRLKEQEPILEKVRAEIEQDAFKDVNGSKYIFVNRVNQIIDKYKAEVKPQERNGEEV